MMDTDTESEALLEKLEDEVELSFEAIKAKAKSFNKKKILCLRLPFDLWLCVAKKSLEDQKQRNETAIQIISEYFAKQS